MAVPQELATQEGGASPAPTKANPRTHTQNRRVGHPAISEQITAIRKLGLGAILNPRAQPGMAVPPRPENPRAHAQNRRVGHPETGPPEGGRYKNQKTQEGGVKPPLHTEKTQIEALGDAEGIADAEEFVCFGGGDAAVGG